MGAYFWNKERSLELERLCRKGAYWIRGNYSEKKNDPQGRALIRDKAILGTSGLN